MFDLYKKTAIGDVTTYVRPCQTLSVSALTGPGQITISEETVIVPPDASVLTIPSGAPDITANISDPTQAFNLIDPTSGAVIGTKTFAQLKVELYSLYLYLAAIRDAG